MRQDNLDQGANGLGLSVSQQEISSSGSGVTNHRERDFISQGGRGRGRGGRRGRHDDPRVQLSKRLTYALRHGAEKLGLRLRPDGFVSLDELLSKPSFRGVSRQQVEQVVAADEKGRMTIATFPVSGGEAAGSATACADPGAATNQAVFIRANQGHSVKGVIDEEKLLTRVEDAADVPVCVHGTDRKSWSSIREDGLRCMNRTHIHFAAGLPGESGVISGMRKACKVLIYVDVAAAMSDGVVFFRSSNNVILSSGKNGTLEPRYFSRVDGATTTADDGASKSVTPDKHGATPRDPPPLPPGKGDGGPTKAATASRQLRARSGWMLDDDATAEMKCNGDGGGLEAGAE
ncbi:unnamed protein product, partial [Ectocarpus sp. 12 AP-2014]